MLSAIMLSAMMFFYWPINLQHNFFYRHNFYQDASTLSIVTLGTAAQKYETQDSDIKHNDT
jgi:hypothetical protein